jgi:diguanylate cyclase (GGDEF)-like protein
VFMTVKLPLRRDDGSIHALCGISTDITERKDIEEHMQHLAQYDALTHLPNRALFNDRLKQAMSVAQRNKSRLALMFIDLDKFKPVNDTYGHGVGDLLLKEVALRIQDCLRESDTAARIGGDEFVVLLPAIETKQDASKVGAKILYTLNQPFALAGHVLGISGSIGVAVYPEHGKDEKLLVKSADIAMYHAKKNGRNNVKIFQSGMQEISE